jgi:hypothetical protein
MKLSSLQKYGIWDRFGFYSGRYKNFTIRIVEGADGFGRTLEYYWVSFQSKKYETGFNSLWDGKKFNTIDEAKEYAIQWVDEWILKNK